MKNFKKILICLILCVFTFGLVACGDSEDNYVYPSASVATYSNGGLAVNKGDYVYFVNGYQSAANTEQETDYVVGSLMIAKLDENGDIMLNEKGLMRDEHYRTMYSKLAGFEATGLYIFGDYLYFTAQCQNNESGDTEWASDRVDFNRIKLDGSGDVERVYQSEVAYSNLEYQYYNDNNGVYLLVYESGSNLDDSSISNRLLRVDANSKEVSEVSRDVSSIVMPDIAQDGSVQSVYENTFYVVQDSETDEYILRRYNVLNNTSSDYARFDYSITAEFVGDRYVYITDDNSSMMRANYQQNGTFTYAGPTDTSNGECYLSADGNTIVYIEDNIIEFYINGSTEVSRDHVVVDKEGDSTVSTIIVIGFANGRMYYYDDTNDMIKSVSVSSSDTSVTVIASVTDVNTSYFDLDDEYVYFYKTVGSNSYLHRLRINNNHGEAEEMLGVYIESDIPEEEETEEE